MFRGLKGYLKRFPALVKAHRRLKWLRFEARDVFDSLTARFPSGWGLKGVRTSYGFTFVGTSSWAHRAMRKGTFEQEETSLLLEELHRVDLFVDIGANVGFYVCVARSLGKHVIAIEPQAKNLKFLYANLLNNGFSDAEVYPLGLSDNPALATLYGPSGTGASMIGGWARQSKRYRKTIPLTTLDALLGQRFTGKRLVIKIDVEGAEYLVLKGAETVLSMQPRPIWIVEICFDEFHPEGINPRYAETFEIFWRHGYEARTADARRRLICREDVRKALEVGRSDSGAIDYVFTYSSQKSSASRGAC